MRIPNAEQRILLQLATGHLPLSSKGRWLSPDPAGTKAVTLTDPQTWNLYAYVRNNPTTLTDPTGLVVAPSGCGQHGVDCKHQAPVVQQLKKAYNEWRKIIAAHPNVAAAIQIGVAIATRGESEEGAGGEVETPSGGASSRGIGTGETTGGGEKSGEGSTGGPSAGKRFSDAQRSEDAGKDCVYCGQKTTEEPGKPNSRQTDHIYPRSRGGNTTPENRAPSCASCNQSKGARTPSEWDGPED